MHLFTFKEMFWKIGELKSFGSGFDILEFDILFE
jgi:hypothetical protein